MRTTLKRGDKGTDVKQMQAALVKHGFDCGEPDGKFGPNTEKWVKAFQKANKLTANGIANEKTLIALGLIKLPKFVQPLKYKQYDSRWGSKMYSSHNDKKQTMKNSGCGPTSMADIVARWWNSKETPYTLAQKAVAWGYRAYEGGTSRNFFKKCASYYKAKKYQVTSSIDTARECLLAGGYVVVNFGTGTKGKPGYKKWTSGGHYCVMWKWDGDYFYINDPGSAASARAKGTRAEVLNARKAFCCFWK